MSSSAHTHFELTLTRTEFTQNLMYTCRSRTVHKINAIIRIYIKNYIILWWMQCHTSYSHA